MTPEEYDAHVARVVAASPPLTRAQLDRLGMILRPMRLPAAVAASKLGRPVVPADERWHLSPLAGARRSACSARPGLATGRAEQASAHDEGAGGVLMAETTPETAEIPDRPLDRSEYKRFLALREPAGWFPLVLGSVERQLQEAASAPTLTAARRAALAGLDATAVLAELRAERQAETGQADDADQSDEGGELAAGASPRGQVAGEEPLW